MTNIKPSIALLAIFTLAIVSACKKDNDNNNIRSKTGIALNAANEIQSPPVVSPATGNMNVSYNIVTHELKWDITWQDLTSDTITGSHIHGSATKSGIAPVKVPFNLPLTRTGSYSGTTTVDGVAIKEDSLLAGYYYLNIHTNRYRGGEIRGQIEFN
jgi:hypothetical protein